MVKNFDEFNVGEIQLNEAEMKLVNEASEKIANIIKNGGEIDEGLFRSLVGGLAGVTVGPMIGKAICQALGITGGLLYNLLTSRVFTTAVASYMGYKN